MKTTHFLFSGMGVMATIGLFVCGPGVTWSGDSGTEAGPAAAEFELEFPRTKSPAAAPAIQPEAAVSPADGQEHTDKDDAFRKLRVIVGADPASVGERYRAVHRLSRNLSRSEIAALYVFLKSPPGPQEDNLPALRLLKNDVLTVLREQRVAPPGLTDTMVGIYCDLGQDPVSRDYAVQQLITWYELGAADAPEAASKIRGVLCRAAREQSSIAGTALLGWHRLSQGDPAFDPEEIDRLALKFVRSDDTDTSTRITAIQVCAERDLKEALPAIELVAKGQVCLPLRRSAMAALKRLSGRESGSGRDVFVDTGEDTERGAVQVALRQAERKEKHD